MKKISGLCLVLVLVLMFSCKDDPCDRPQDIVSKGAGCSSFFLYDTLQDNNTFIWVKGVRHKLGLGESVKQFVFSEENDLSAGIIRFNQEIAPYCSVVGWEDVDIVNEWVVIDGIADIWIPYDITECDTSYYINLKILNTTFRDGMGNSLLVDEKEFVNVLVNQPLF